MQKGKVLGKFETLRQLGRMIAERRHEKGLSQEALAEAGNFDRTYMSLLERGRRNPTFTNLCRLAAALQLSLPDLARRFDECDARNSAISSKRTHKKEGKI